jgi:hypothetical protein
MQTKKYMHAECAARASAAVYLLDAAVGLLDAVPQVMHGQGPRLQKIQRALRAEGKRALKVMDREHARAGVPRNEC